MRDAGSTNFKAFSKFIKEVKESTKATGEALLQGRPGSSTSQTEIASGGIVLKSAM